MPCGRPFRACVAVMNSCFLVFSVYGADDSNFLASSCGISCYQVGVARRHDFFFAEPPRRLSLLASTCPTPNDDQIFPLRYRGRGVSLAVCVNRLTSGLVALAFPLLEKGFTAGGTFFLFTFLSVGTVWFYYVSGGGGIWCCLRVVHGEALFLCRTSELFHSACLVHLLPCVAPARELFPRCVVT